MKVQLDDKHVIELTDIQKQVIKNDIHADIFDADMKRRLTYMIEHPCERFATRNQKELHRRLAERGLKTAPASYMELGNLVSKHGILTEMEREQKKEWVDRLTKGKEPQHLTESIANMPQHLLEDMSTESSTIHVDGQPHFEITGVHKHMFSFMEPCDRSNEGVDKRIVEQLSWILRHKYERCMERLRNHWAPLLASRGIKEIPLDDDTFAQLVFSQPDYKNRKQRDDEEALQSANSTQDPLQEAPAKPGDVADKPKDGSSTEKEKP